jgi:hypothetical protein
MKFLMEYAVHPSPDQATRLRGYEAEAAKAGTVIDWIDGALRSNRLAGRSSCLTLVVCNPSSTNPLPQFILYAPRVKPEKTVRYSRY